MIISALWTIDEILQATRGHLIGDVQTQITGIAMDSRAVTTGDMFIAIDMRSQAGTDVIRTNGLDGHDFVQSACDNGAVVAIVMRELDCDIPQIIVEDSVVALNDLAHYARHRGPLKQAIAITGSVGKTGIREMMRAAMGGCGLKTHASIKSYNNYIGVPYTMATMPRDTQIGVFEAGMNHAGEMTVLSHCIEPTMAVMTWISNQHIENFPDGMDGIVRAKSEVFDGMAHDGMVVLPRDNDYFDDLSREASARGLTKIYSFGEDEQSDARLISCVLTNKGTDIQANILGEDVSYRLQMPGKHIAINSLAALLSVKLSGGDLARACHALEQEQAPAGRGRQFQSMFKGDDNPITVIDDAYNAAPIAMVAAINVLAMMTPDGNGRRIALLGHMAELGDNSDTAHLSLLKPLTDGQIDKVYCCGERIKILLDALPADMQGGYFETSDDLKAVLGDVMAPNDVVLVKGSYGVNMRQIVEILEKTI